MARDRANVLRELFTDAVAYNEDVIARHRNNLGYTEVVEAYRKIEEYNKLRAIAMEEVTKRSRSGSLTPKKLVGLFDALEESLE